MSRPVQASSGEGPGGLGLLFLMVGLALTGAGVWFFGLFEQPPMGVQGTNGVPDAPPEIEVAEQTREGSGTPAGVPGAEDLVPPVRLDQPPEPAAVVPWHRAHEHLGSGEVIEVRGTIVDTHNSGRACFLNFTEDWEGRFYCVILGRSLESFEEPERTYLGRSVRVFGRVEEYQGRPQIVIERPEQLLLAED